MGLGIKDIRGPAVVVGEKQEAFARLVEPPHRGKPGEISIHEAVINGFPPFFVGRGHDQPAGLVEHEINFSCRGDRPAIRFEAVQVHIQTRFRVPDYGPVQLDPSLPDEVEGFAPGVVPSL